MLFALTFSCLLSFVTVASLDRPLSGFMALDFALALVLPWIVGVFLYGWVRNARVRSLGPERARPPLTAGRAVLCTTAMHLSDAMFAGVTAKLGIVNGVLVFAAVSLLLIPLHEVRRCLRP
jgi:hypothetical protein